MKKDRQRGRKTEKEGWKHREMERQGDAETYRQKNGRKKERKKERKKDLMQSISYPYKPLTLVC
jgi:hypothetical protein